MQADLVSPFFSLQQNTVNRISWNHCLLFSFKRSRTWQPYTLVSSWLVQVFIFTDFGISCFEQCVIRTLISSWIDKPTSSITYLLLLPAATSIYTHLLASHLFASDLCKCLYLLILVSVASNNAPYTHSLVHESISFERCAIHTLISSWIDKLTSASLITYHEDYFHMTSSQAQV